MLYSHGNSSAAHLEPILTTKLQPPTLIHKLVARPRLLKRLDQSFEAKLTLLCAPAGYGKTTLLTNWLDGRDMPVAWVSLDERDDHPTRFWHYICTALARIHASIGEQLALFLETSTYEYEATLVQMMNVLDEVATPFALVLDDYHLITAEPIQRTLTFLLDHMPAHMHLILLTRFEPALPLARLRVRGQVIEIREADLRFTLKEVEEFFRSAPDLSFDPVHIQALAERTEGWIAGLQLAALALRSHPDSEQFIISFTGSSRYIVDYLLEEVLRHQTEEVQTFLLSTAILSRLSASLCTAVLGAQEESQQDGVQTSYDLRYCQEMLEYIECANLFLIPLDHERRWYRYHHLFAEALVARLSLLNPSRIAELHRRTSAWYEQQGYLSEAIEHALLAQDVVRAACLIEQIASTSMSSISYGTLLRWMKATQEQEIRTRPRLCFLWAWVLVLSGSRQWGVIEQWIDEGMRKLSQNQTISDEMTGEVAAIHATVACFRGETERAIEQGQQALQLLPAAHWQQGSLLIILGSAFLLSGDMDNATQVLTRALHSFQMQNLSPYFFRMAKFFFAEAQTRRGRLSKALELYQEILTAGASQPDRAVVFACGGLGNVLLERNELDAARSCIEQGVKLFSVTGSALRTAVNIYIPLARAQYAQGEVDAAFATLVRLEQQAQRDTSKRLQAMFAAKRAQLHLQQGDIAAAVQWAETRGLGGEDILQMPAKADTHEFEYLVFARVLIAQEHYHQASNVLKQLLQAAQKAERRASVFEIQIVQALLEQAKGASVHALHTVEHVLAETEAEGYIRLFVDEGMPMHTLLSRVQAKEQHMQRYVQRILSAYQTPTLAPVSIAHSVSLTSLSKPQPLLDPLSERELAVLQLLAVGETNAAIAERLIIAPATVKRHLSNIFSKLGVANRTQAAAQARELSLL